MKTPNTILAPLSLMQYLAIKSTFNKAEYLNFKTTIAGGYDLDKTKWARNELNWGMV